jgi:SPW repeat
LSVYRSFNFFRSLSNRRRKEVDLIIRSHETCNLPPGEYFFIRFFGDEAVVGLSFAQSITYALDVIVDFVYVKCSNFVTRLASNRFIGREFPEIFCSVVLGLWLLLSPWTVGYNLSLTEATNIARNLGLGAQAEIREEIADLEKEIKNIQARHAGEIYTEGQPLDPDIRRAANLLGHIRDRKQQLEQPAIDNATIYKFYIMRSLKLMSALLFNLVAVVAVLIILIFAGLRAFGTTELAEILYVDHSVEVLPYGDHGLIHLDWKQVKSGFTHSQTHSSASALQKVAKWVSEHV